MISRRSLLGGISAVAGLPLFSRARAASIPEHAAHENHAESHNSGETPAAPGKLITPNGRTLPWQWVDGAKQFHLVAEEIEHEFAPGCVAKCWGYNGSTPGPTIEAVEGERVRILVSNHLKEPTSMHWHGLLLPNGMDGVAGLNQPAIQPGETWAYEFTLRQAGSHMYHPHADELVQMAFGMMGLFIVHPRGGEPERIDHDFGLLLHNWALRPGTYRPDPSVLLDFDLWTFNSKVFPATAPLLVRQGERVRIRIGNLSMWNHPIHLHGHRFQVTGSDGDRWPRSAWRREVTEIVGVGQMRDIEFVADNPGDWAFHCHMAHHTMNAMGHGLPSPVGVRQDDLAERIDKLVPGTMLMGETGMSGHAEMAAMMPGPANTLPMMGGDGPFGSVEMGGMFTVLKVRDQLPADGGDPGWYRHPPGTMARRVSVESSDAVEPAGHHHHGGG